MSFRNLADLEDALRAGSLTARELHGTWEQRLLIPDPESDSNDRSTDRMQNSARLVAQFTQRALEKEEFLLVCDCAREALRRWAGAGDQDRLELVRVRMHHAAALARLGDTRRARQVLEPCVEDGFSPRLDCREQAAVFLQLGNILRQESRHAATPAARAQTSGQALEFYANALEAEPDCLEALSLSASAALTASEPGSALRSQATEQARRVLREVRDRENADGPRFATAEIRAAAHAVLGDTDAAAVGYAELETLPGATSAALANARYWAQFLAEGLGRGSDFFRPAFPPLPLVVFSGHLLDRPGEGPRFPSGAILAARATIQAVLEEHGVRVGMCSAAAGADLIFLDTLRDRDGTTHIVLPWSREEFRRTSILSYEPGGSEPPRWEPLFERALAEAATVREIGQSYRADSGVGHEYQLEVMAGLALQAARVARLDVQPMAWWDGRPGRGQGGTASFVEFWQRFGLEPVILSPPPVAAETSAAASPAATARPARDADGHCEHDTFRQEVKSVLFADIVGYSKLNESVIPEFVHGFLAELSRTLSGSRYAPQHVNTWGDAIYAVFDYAHDAGCFALELTRLIHEKRDAWLAMGLSWEEAAADGTVVRQPINVRVGLHTGPVFMHHDPVTRRLGFTGVHVNRAARIEPVAAPGEVYASEEFAALAEIDRHARTKGENAATLPTGFICEYAGTMELAKGFPGRHRIYRVTPDKIFAIEELARAIHEAYVEAGVPRGEKPPGANGALRPWEELAVDLRQANFAQAADVPNKLRALGYELAPGHGLKASEIVLAPEAVEAMAIREHDRWARERRRLGWTYGPVRDNARKLHPLLVPWKILDETEREKDRATVRNVPWLVERAGFRVRKLDA